MTGLREGEMEGERRRERREGERTEVNNWRVNFKKDLKGMPSRYHLQLMLKPNSGHMQSIGRLPRATTSHQKLEEL